MSKNITKIIVNDIEYNLGSESFGEENVQSDWNETDAISDAYIKNKPIIPTKVSELTNDSGFTKNVGTITGIKMNGTSIGTSGIVDLGNVITEHQDISAKQDTITDLEVIRQGAAKGATALQSYTEQYKGTVTGVKVNGTIYPPESSGGLVDIGTVITSHQDISGKQDKLVSGTNIKTINGTSILGSGDIVISGSGSSGNGAYSEVNHGTSDTTFTLTPNTFHIWDEVTTLDLSLGEETEGIANEFLFQFTSGSEPTTLILQDSIKFNSDFTVEENKIYQISILNGLGTIMSWDIEPTIQLITFTIDGTEYQAEEGMYWDEWVNSEYNNAGWLIKQDVDMTMRFFIENNTNPNRVLYVSGMDGIIYNIKANETYKTVINMVP